MIASIAAASNSINSSGATPSLIRNLEATFYNFQRHNVQFSITNTTTGTGNFSWKILNLTTPGITATSTFRNPTFTLPQGHYLLYGEVQGLNPDPVCRVFWHKRITVLPNTFTEGEADEVLDLDTGNNIYDASGWIDGAKIFVKAASTVGRIRINNYNYTTTKAHLYCPDPIEVDTFAGSSGFYLVNCTGLICDFVGDNDAYGMYLNGTGDNTSHGIVLNTVTDIRCEFVEIYGVEINVPQSGASGIRVLGDETATYNRVDLAPCDGLKFGHIKITESGHEALYFGYTNDTDGGNGGPRQFINTEAWDWHIVTCGRDAIQPCNQINGRFHNFTIDACATLGEPSHDSYIVHNSGNQSCKIFNIFGKGGVHGISVQFGETGSNPMLWNIVLDVVTLPSQSTWNFLQVGDAANTDIAIMNVTEYAVSGDEICYRLDSQVSQGTQDIIDFTLINCTTVKGTSAAFFQKDGTNDESGWDRTSGNLTYIPATEATALLGTDRLPNDVLSPSITGGVSMTTRRSYSEFCGEYGALQFEADIHGYCKVDGDFNSGAGSGLLLKLAEL